jgi:uncharacterized protein YbjT (DUF2867 family)
MTVLVVGATGSIGHLVVEEAIRQGHTARALVRDPRKARLPKVVEVIAGDLTRPETLTPAVDRVDAVVFTHGSDGSGKDESERVDYGGVRNVLNALGGRSIRIALMTAIGVTNREGDYNRQTEAHDWSVVASAWCAPAVCRTPSCDQDGSTTTSRTSGNSYSFKATDDMPAIRVTASSLAGNLPRF